MMSPCRPSWDHLAPVSPTTPPTILVEVYFKSKGEVVAVEDVGIGEVARRAGVRPSALCYYERVGLLPSPEREGGRGRYGGEVLREGSYT